MPPKKAAASSGGASAKPKAAAREDSKDKTAAIPKKKKSVISKKSTKSSLAASINGSLIGEESLSGTLTGPQDSFIDSMAPAEGEEEESLEAPVVRTATTKSSHERRSSQETERRVASSQKSPSFAVHVGPRPDEELLDAVKEEANLGDEASVERIYEMLRNDEDVNQRTELGYTPLAVAAAAGNGPLVSILLERGADVSLRSIHRAELPLHHAARRGNRVVVQLLCEQTAAAGLIDEPNIIGFPPLFLAALAGHAPVIVTLLSHGADINVRNSMSGNITILHAAVKLGGVQAAEELLDRGAAVDAHDSLGRGPLHLAAAKADQACVSLLLRSKADPMNRGTFGKTPLDCVPEFHPNREKVSTLLKAYMRQMPEPFRADARFDRIDARELEIVF